MGATWRAFASGFGGIHDLTGDALLAPDSLLGLELTAVDADLVASARSLADSIQDDLLRTRVGDHLVWLASTTQRYESRITRLNILVAVSLVASMLGVALSFLGWLAPSFGQLVLVGGIFFLFSAQHRADQLQAKAQSFVRLLFRLEILVRRAAEADDSRRDRLHEQIYDSLALQYEARELAIEAIGWPR